MNSDIVSIEEQNKELKLINRELELELSRIKNENDNLKYKIAGHAQSY